MTLDERAARLAKNLVSTAAVPFSVCVTQFQQDKVIHAAIPIVLAELKDLLEEHRIKFTP